MASNRTDYDSVNNFATVLSSLLDNPLYKERYAKHLEREAAKAENPEDRAAFLAQADEVTHKGALSYDDIARICGVDRSTAARWARPKNPAIPSAAVVARLATVFGVTSDYLLGLDDVPERQAQSEFDVLKSVGLSVTSYRTLKWYQDAPPSEQRLLVLGAVNKLLEQGDCVVLKKLGQFLLCNAQENPHYYFDQDDVDELFDVLTSKDNADAIECFRAFLENSPRLNTTAFPSEMLDAVRDALREYKEDMDPGFFEQFSELPGFYKMKE